MPNPEAVTAPVPAPGGNPRAVPLLGLDAADLVRCSARKLLSLSLEEMRAVQAHFRTLGRDPTDVELETIAQTWSEHCKHKTFKGIIHYVEHGPDGLSEETFDDLLKATIVRATKELDRPFCLSVFEDNAGIIDFDGENAAAFKVETHNHPSALEPYGGAGTGIGGVIRDILGAGLGARPVANTDVFCVGRFGRGDGAAEAGILSPERILSGVVSGVRDYGNRMGIPTVNGAVLFHDGYRANPLVFCGTAGVIPKDKIAKKVSPGDLVVALGGRTGRDGIHGATFSSLALEEGISSSMVQIGNPIVEKKTADALLRARDAGLYRAVTDCGAGGFSSAVGELADGAGARIQLENAPLKYAGLAPWEIWLSESQERMVAAVPEKDLDAFRKICGIEDVECSVIGTFSSDNRLKVYHGEEMVCDLDLDFLHRGIPRVRKEAVWRPRPARPAGSSGAGPVRGADAGRALERLLAHPNIGSKKWVVRQYDHEVQGGSVVKPFAGAGGEGPSDAAVVRPDLDSWKGLVLSNGINPFYGEIDPYWMAANAVEEALRNLVAVGGDPDLCAILDNFCWGDVSDPSILGDLVRCARGCYDFSKGFGTPFISGKDSLNNTWRGPDGKISSIPGTLLISAIGVIDDVRKCVTMDLKRPGNRILLAGETRDEFGGSHFGLVAGNVSGEVPKVDAGTSLALMRAIRSAMGKGWIESCHDLSEGGLAVALAEMCIAGNLGADADLAKAPGPLSGKNAGIRTAFSESAGRWLIEVSPANLAGLKKHFRSLPLAAIGSVTRAPVLKVRSAPGKTLLRLKVADMKRSWNSFSEAR